jgi:alkaline phosphatase D
MSGPFRRIRSVLSRRDFLRRTAIGLPVMAMVPTLPGCGSSDPAVFGFEDNPFRHGVASGDPQADRVILWTRVTPVGTRAIPVTVEVARHPDMSGVVGRRQALAQPERDFTVKLDFDGLAAFTTYYYRFSAGGFQSPIGRTRTLPVGAVDRVRLGIVSCSSLAHGFFGAYRRLAERADIDVVLHLGDYIYEYGTGQYGNVRPYEPPTEILTLADYRTRYSQYHLDPDQQEIHRQHPMICVWDDHESTDNSFRENAKNHTEGPIEEGGEGCWVQRKAWAIQAYREWLPIRDNLADYVAPLSCDPDEVPVERRRAQERIWRRFEFGELAELVMLDTRLYGRDIMRRPNIVPPQAAENTENDVQDIGLFAGCAPPFTEDYQLLGEEQEAWFFDGLRNSTARWKLVGQQIMMAPLQVVGLPQGLCALPSSSQIAQLINDAGGGPLGQVLGGIIGSLPEIAASSILLNADQWDGYPVARRRVLDVIADNAIDNVVVLTGDIHTSWASDLTPDPNNPLAYQALSGGGSLGVEFVCTSITSPGLDVLAPVSEALRLNNPHMKYIDLARKGYMVLDVTPERCQGEWWYVDDILDPGTGESFGAGYFTADGGNRVQTASGASSPRADAPALAP